MSDIVSLGCSLDRVLLIDLRGCVGALLSAGDGSLSPELTCLWLDDRCVPLCQADVRAAAPSAPLSALYEKLGLVVHRSSKRPLSRSTNSTVRRVLQWASAALDACTELMTYLDRTGFAEGSVEQDRSVRAAVESVERVLTEVLEAPYNATPLLLLAALCEGGLPGVLAVMLQGRDVAELTRRGALFYQVLQLLRRAALLPDVACLLAAPARLRGVSVSVLGCLSALADHARVVLDWDRAGASTGLHSGDAARDQMRKMARRLRETHEALASQVAARSQQAMSAAAAQLPPPPEVAALDALIASLRVGRGAAAATTTPTGADAPGGGGDVGSGTYANPLFRSQQGGSGAGYGGVAGGGSSYLSVHGSSYGDGASAPYAGAHGGEAWAAGGRSAPADAEAVHVLRTQRELMRLQAAAAAAAAGGGNVTGSGGFVRDGYGHHSQSSQAVHDYRNATSTLTYPWQQQQQQQQQHYETAPAGAASYGGQRDAHFASQRVAAAGAEYASLLAEQARRALTPQRAHQHSQPAGGSDSRQQQGTTAGGGASAFTSTGGYTGQHLGGYSLTGARADPAAPLTVAAAAEYAAAAAEGRPRSSARVRMSEAASPSGFAAAQYAPNSSGGGAAMGRAPAQGWTASPAAHVPPQAPAAAAGGDAGTLSGARQPYMETLPHAAQRQAQRVEQGAERQSWQYMELEAADARSTTSRGGAGVEGAQEPRGGAQSVPQRPIGAGPAPVEEGMVGARVRLVEREAARQQQARAMAAAEALVAPASARTPQRSATASAPAGSANSAAAPCSSIRQANSSTSTSSSDEEWRQRKTLRAIAEAAGLYSSHHRSPREGPPAPKSPAPAPQARPSAVPASPSASSRLLDEYLELNHRQQQQQQQQPGTSRARPASPAPSPRSTAPHAAPASPPSSSSSYSTAPSSAAYALTGASLTSPREALSRPAPPPHAMRPASPYRIVGNDLSSAARREALRPEGAPQQQPRPESPQPQRPQPQAQHPQQRTESQAVTPPRTRAAVPASSTVPQSSPARAASGSSSGARASAAASHHGRPSAGSVAVRPRTRLPAADGDVDGSSSDASDAYHDYDEAAQLRRAMELSRAEAEAAERAATEAAVAAAMAAAAAQAGPGEGGPGGRGSHRSTASASSAVSEGGGQLLGAKLPLSALHQRYATLSPLLAAKLVSLEDDFPAARRVAGDGNCFYRAALFALLEAVLSLPDPALGDRLEAVVGAHLRTLDGPPASPRRTSASAAGAAGGGAVPPGSPRTSAAAAVPRTTPVHSPRASSADGAAALEGGQLPPRTDPAAQRGGELLLRLLRLAWYKAPDATAPSYITTLEVLFNCGPDSADAIAFARSLTVAELLSDEAFYEPFIPGCGRGYTGLSLRQICARHVLPMGQEVEQLQMIALCSALGATLGVLDVAGSAVGAIKHGPRDAARPPAAWVIHLPGHYEVVYPAKPLDVAAGGVLVPAAG